MFDAGKLSDVQTKFWQSKSPEELYDLSQDRYQINNLVDSAEHQQVLERLRQANRDHLLTIRDLGFLPEPEMLAASDGNAPYDVGHDELAYPLEKILAVAEEASSLHGGESTLVERLDDSTAAVRYWAALGLLMRGQSAVADARSRLLDLLENDPSLSVRIVAAEAPGKVWQARRFRTGTRHIDSIGRCFSAIDPCCP